MQVIYDDASNIRLTAQKRLVRVVYGQTQITPYACILDPSLRNSEGAVEVPGAGATVPVKRSEAVFTFRNSIVPGTVLVKTEGEYVVPAAGNKAERPFGLLGQWVGGTFDNLKGTNEVSAWLGPDGVVDLLKPAFNINNDAAESITTVLAAQKAGLAAETELSNAVAIAGPNSLVEVVLESEAITDKQVVIADVVELLNANVLRLKLRI
jgi:hypothetical protein